MIAVIFTLFFFNATATTEIYTLSLHDALPISGPRSGTCRSRPNPPHQGRPVLGPDRNRPKDRKSTRLNSSHTVISYAVFCLKKKINDPTYTLSFIRAGHKLATLLTFTTINHLA